MNESKCFKCGKTLKQGDITTDHIPPKCFVTPANRSKLIKVDACRGCNLGRSKDDEYFRNWIIAGAVGLNTEAGKIYQEKVKKSWTRRPAIMVGMRERLSKEDLFTPAGIYLGRVTYVNIEEHRAIPVLDSIAKGVLWHHSHNIEHKFPFGLDPFILHNPPLDSDWMEIFLAISAPFDLIPEIFTYRFGHFARSSDDLFHVFLYFYNREMFHLHYLVDKKSRLPPTEAQEGEEA